jgi:sec-independent protein translocase protein TatC
MTISSQPDSAGAAPGEETGGQMTFFEHLIELRKRIINSLVSIAVGAMIGWAVAPHFVNWITRPMLKALGNAHLDQKLVYTHPAGYLNLLITLSIYLGLVIASPWILYQIWLFVAPALYKHERSAITGFLFSTVFLFLSGIAFGYFIMLPYILRFLISFQGPVVPLISINEYFDLILMILLGLGLVFELPILIIAIVAAIITPTPDATTMLIFMAPMVGLYFLGVGVSWVVVRRRDRRLAPAAEAQ